MSTNKLFDIFLYSLIVLVLILDIVLFFDYKSIKNTKEDVPVVINQSSVIKVNFNNYTFDIPEEYKYRIDEDIFYISYNEFSLNIQITDKKYNDILSNKDDIKNNFENYGYKINDVFYNNKYLAYSIQDDSLNHFVIYLDLDMNDTFVIEVVDKYDNFDNIINKINPILNSIKYKKQI